ncbi:MAG: hypothetical protein ACREQ3_19765, partial [Candidatus Binatia bacterium]
MFRPRYSSIKLHWRRWLTSIILLVGLTLGTAVAQTEPVGNQLPGSKPDQSAVFEIKVRDGATGYAVPAVITISPRVPAPTGDAVQVPADVYTGPPGPGRVLFKRGGAEPPGSGEVYVPDISNEPVGSGEVLLKGPGEGSPGDLVAPGTLTVRANMGGPTLITVEPGIYNLSVSAEGYKPGGTSYYTAEPGATLRITSMKYSPTLPDRLRPETVIAKLKPGFVVFHGHVVDDFNGQPLAGVSVSLIKSGVQTTTDEDGYFFLQVPAPPPIELEPHEMPPIEDLVAELPGYKQHRDLNMRLQYGSRSIIELERGVGVTEKDHTHGLY